MFISRRRANSTSAKERSAIFIDTKFANIIKKGQYRDILSSGYIYQIYAYLQSQTNIGDEIADNASGLLLHPAVNDMINETVVVQGHAIRFASVDLAASAVDIRNQLFDVIKLI